MKTFFALLLGCFGCFAQPSSSLSDLGFLSSVNKPYPLDLGITFTGAWGTAPLSKSSQRLFTIRRASDGATQMVSRLGRTADYATIQSFWSSTNGSITNLIDQVGSSLLSQSTVSQIPDYADYLGFASASLKPLSSGFTLSGGPSTTGRNFSLYFVYGTRDRTYSAITSIPLGMTPYVKADAASYGLYSSGGVVTQSVRVVLGWGGFPVVSNLMGGNASINIFSVNSTASKTRFRLNEYAVETSTLASATTQSITNVGLGAASSYGISACLLAMLVGPSHTTNQEQQIYTSLQNLFKTRPKTKLVAFDGDSITAGHLEATGFDERELSWPYELLSAIGDPSVFGFNKAISSSVIVDTTGAPYKSMTEWATNKLDAYLNSSYAKKILVVSGGGNDLSLTNSGSVVYSRLVSYCQARRTAGWEKIIVLNCAPRKDLVTKNLDAERLDYNSRIAGNANTDWDATVDNAASNWQPGGTNDWTTNFQGTSGIHPNAAGRALISNATKSTLQGYLQ